MPMWSVDAGPRGCLGPVGAALGEIFDARPPAEAIWSPAWQGWARQQDNLVERSEAAGVVKKGVAERAIGPWHH